MLSKSCKKIFKALKDEKIIAKVHTQKMWNIERE
jgi:hypothetical protein